MRFPKEKETQIRDIEILTCNDKSPGKSSGECSTHVMRERKRSAISKMKKTWLLGKSAFKLLAFTLRRIYLSHPLRPMEIVQIHSISNSYK